MERSNHAVKIVTNKTHQHHKFLTEYCFRGFIAKETGKKERKHQIKGG